MHFDNQIIAFIKVVLNLPSNIDRMAQISNYLFLYLPFISLIIFLIHYHIFFTLQMMISVLSQQIL